MVEAWLEAFIRWLQSGRRARAREAIEVFSDVSAEPYMNAVAARHLHRFGFQTNPRFWARSEWRKVDISYGITRGDIVDWRHGRRAGLMGDLGQIEVKALYTTTKRATKYFNHTVEVLAGQLNDRRRRHAEVANGLDARGLAFHGLLWLHDHGLGKCDTEALQQGRVAFATQTVLDALERTGLKPEGSRRAEPFRLVAREDLGATWPVTRGNYVGELRALLVRLP